MELTLEDKIRAIFNSGNLVKIEKVLRTVGGETYYKYVWTVDGIQTRHWLGFDSIDDCVDDCLTYLVITKY